MNSISNNEPQIFSFFLIMIIENTKFWWYKLLCLLLISVISTKQWIVIMTGILNVGSISLYSQPVSRKNICLDWTQSYIYYIRYRIFYISLTPNIACTLCTYLYKYLHCCCCFLKPNRQWQWQWNRRCTEL